MNYILFLKCFFVGVVAASGCGPVFIMTFNKGALCGFLRGFVTALGAAFGDALYFFLGLMGALAVMSQFKGFVAWLDLIGGIVARIDGKLLDGSTRSKLTALKRELIGAGK